MRSSNDTGYRSIRSTSSDKDPFNRPDGTPPQRAPREPSVETLGYSRWYLRDQRGGARLPIGDALRRFAGDAAKNANFRAHAAQFEVEAWILPFWDEITKKLSVKAPSPGANPEQVNGQKPPSHRLKELFRRGKCEFDKILDGPKWLTADRLDQAAEVCPELRSFLDSLLEFAGAGSLP